MRALKGSKDFVLFQPYLQTLSEYETFKFTAQDHKFASALVDWNSSDVETIIKEYCRVRKLCSWYEVQFRPPKDLPVVSFLEKVSALLTLELCLQNKTSGSNVFYSGVILIEETSDLCTLKSVKFELHKLRREVEHVLNCEYYQATDVIAAFPMFQRDILIRLYSRKPTSKLVSTFLKDFTNEEGLRYIVGKCITTKVFEVTLSKFYTENEFVSVAKALVSMRSTVYVALLCILFHGSFEGVNECHRLFCRIYDIPTNQGDPVSNVFDLDALIRIVLLNDATNGQ